MTTTINLSSSFYLHVHGSWQVYYPACRGSLFDVVRDDSRWSRVTQAALETSIQWAADNPDSTKEHKRLLEDIHSGCTWMIRIRNCLACC